MNFFLIEEGSIYYSVITQYCKQQWKLKFRKCSYVVNCDREIHSLSREEDVNYLNIDPSNEKMIELGYNGIYNDVDPNLLKQMEWFGHLTSGKTHQDFFAGRVTNYSKSNADWSDL